MAESTKTYVVTASSIGVPIGTDPRTGIDTVQYYGETEEVELTAEQAKRLLKLKAVRDPNEKTEEQAAADEAEQAEVANLTKKQALQKEAGELGLEFDEKTTILQLEALIAEEKEKRKDTDQTGVTGENPGS